MLLLVQGRIGPRRARWRDASAELQRPCASPLVRSRKRPWDLYVALKLLDVNGTKECTPTLPGIPKAEASVIVVSSQFSEKEKRQRKRTPLDEKKEG